MPRSAKKPPFVDYSLLKLIRKARESSKPIAIKTKSRRSVILPDMVGLMFQIYNGKTYVPVSVNETMVGYKLGEFAPTRTYYGHGADKKAKRK